MFDSLYERICMKMQFSKNDDGSLCILLVSITLSLVALAYFGTILILRLATKRFAELCEKHPEWNTGSLKIDNGDDIKRKSD